MNKTMKSLLLALGATGAVAAPVAALVACGSTKDESTDGLKIETNLAGTELTVTIDQGKTFTSEFLAQKVKDEMRTLTVKAVFKLGSAEVSFDIDPKAQSVADIKTQIETAFNGNSDFKAVITAATVTPPTTGGNTGTVTPAVPAWDKTLPTGTFYLLAGKTNEYTSDITKAEGYSAEVKPAAVTIPAPTAENQTVVVAGKTYTSKAGIYSLPAGTPTPAFEIANKFFTTLDKALAEAQITAATTGFFKGTDYQATQPQVNDPAYQDSASGFVNTTTNKYSATQPMIDDNSWSPVAVGSYFRGTEYSATKPAQVADTSYNTGVAGFYKGDDYVATAPQVADTTLTQITQDAAYDFAHANGGALWIELATGILKSDADISKLPTTGVLDLTADAASTNANPIDPAKYVQKYIGANAKSAADIKDTNLINDPAYQDSASGFVNTTTNKYSATQPMIDDNSWSPVAAGSYFKGTEYSATKPAQVADTSYNTGVAGFYKGDDYVATAPQVADTSYLPVATGSYIKGAKYLADEAAAKTEGNIVDAHLTVTAAVVNIDGVDYTPTTQIAYDGLVTATFYAKGTEFVTDFKQADGYTAAVNPAATTLPVDGTTVKTITVNGTVYTWIVPATANPSLVLDVVSIY